MLKTLLVIVFMVVAAASCNKTDSVPEKPAYRQPPIVIGLLPEQDIFRQLERYEPVTKYISTKLGRGVKLRILRHYRSIIDNFLNGRIDGAFLGSFSYVIAHKRVGVEVVARPELADGTSTYHGVIFVRKESGIDATDKMKGRVFAFVDTATTAGFLLPLAYFKDNGIENYRSFFRETYFSGTHEGAIYDVLNGKADVGAAKNTVYKRLAQADDRIANSLAIIARSPEVPENAFAIRNNLDPAIITHLKKILLHMHEDPEGIAILRNFGARRFLVTTDQDYEPVRKYARTAGINMATYDPVNN